MLRFIVLGQLPGTDIQLTFLQISLTAVLFYGSLALLHQFRTKAKTAASSKNKPA